MEIGDAKVGSLRHLHCHCGHLHAYCDDDCDGARRTVWIGMVCIGD